jgi:hypothetical protein
VHCTPALWPCRSRLVLCRPFFSPAASWLPRLPPPPPSLRCCRPAFMDEYERLERELAEEYDAYVTRFRNLDFLQHELDVHNKVRPPSGGDGGEGGGEDAAGASRLSALGRSAPSHCLDPSRLRSVLAFVPCAPISVAKQSIQCTAPEWLSPMPRRCHPSPPPPPAFTNSPEHRAVSTHGCAVTPATRLPRMWLPQCFAPPPPLLTHSPTLQLSQLP